MTKTGELFNTGLHGKEIKHGGTEKKDLRGKKINTEAQRPRSLTEKEKENNVKGYF